MKEFVVIGLGNFGATVAKQLYQLGCNITAIDVNKARVQDLQEHTHQAIIADATDRKFLENLEVKNFDCFVVSTGEDSHASILISLYLKELGAKKIVVKANSTDHVKILLKVGATEALIPEEEMALKLAHSLAFPNVLDFLPLSEEYSIAELVPPPKFAGKSLIDLELRSKHHIEVIAIRDVLTRKLQFIPSAGYQIKDSDILVVLGKDEDIEGIRG
ncbi:MAG: hypothetical protein B6D58_09120 [candidate division Zixibacteria bacterium 4484_95]|nr:MAG: hypothetical protein B6D58_09120 [candidate division Zixibacteria bacterium 4484_95]